MLSQRNVTLSAKQPLVHGAGTICFISEWSQTKLLPNKFTRRILKARGSRRGGPTIKGLVWAWRVLSVWIGLSTPPKQDGRHLTGMLSAGNSQAIIVAGIFTSDEALSLGFPSITDSTDVREF